MPFVTKQGDITKALKARLINGDGVTVNLTGATVDFSMRLVKDGSLTIDRATATILSELPPVDPDDPNVEYQWAATETDVAGNYHGEFVVVDGASDEGRFPDDRHIEIEIRKAVKT